MLTCQRELFSVPEDVHYLNCASMAPLLRSAEAAGIAGLTRQRAPESKSPDEYFREPTELRNSIGQLVNCDPQNVALIPSVSYGVAIAAHNLQVSRDQNMVVVEEEFPSDVYPWIRACEESGAEFRQVPRVVSGTEWNARLLESIDQQTALVCLSTVNWTDGIRFDVQAVADRCREVGAMFVLDGTQSIGAAPFDFARVKPDLLVCAGYKWLLGPYQMGFAVVGERLLDGKPFELHWSTRAGSEDTSNPAYHPHFRPGARRFDVGEQGNPITVPMLRTGIEQILAWQVEEVAQYLQMLARHLDAGLDSNVYTLLPEGEREAHILGLRTNRVDRIPAIMDALKRANIRISRRGDVLRVSPHLHCDTANIDALLQVLEDAAR